VVIGRLICRIVAHAPWLWPVVNKRVMGFFDAQARGWDTRTDAGSPAHLAPLAAAVLKVPARPERLLDVGCGTGAATLFLAREYPQARVRGVDLSPRMIKEANNKIGLDPEARVAFRAGDASKLPYPDQNFDLVSQTNMPIFFAEIDRVLRPGGSVIITSSSGQETPFSTPEKTVIRKFDRLGISMIETGVAGRGEFYVGRKREKPQ